VGGARIVEPTGAPGALSLGRTPVRLPSRSLCRLASPRVLAVAAQHALVAAIAIAGCRADKPPVMADRDQSPAVADRDDFGDPITVPPSPARRIVSLDPATTAMLFAMGQGPRLVGRTRWDTYPPAALAVPNVGDGLRPNIEAVLAQRPDLVLLYAGADDRAAARELQRAGVATLSLRLDRVDDFRRVLRIIGRVLHDSVRAATVADSVSATIARAHRATSGVAPVSVIWQVDESPLRVIGGGSYLNELVTDAGGHNLYSTVADPAPQVSLEDVLRKDPDVLLTTPAGARAVAQDPRWRTWLATRRHRLVVPDTALVGMPSVRMGEAAFQLATLLHPDAVH
jgi:iron complex transport system substrate-binding protein